MITSLTIVLGASMLMFIASLAYAVIADWIDEKRSHKNLPAEAYLGFSNTKRYFDTAARRPMRVLGSFIL